MRNYFENKKEWYKMNEITLYRTFKGLIFFPYLKLEIPIRQGSYLGLDLL